MSVIVHSNTSRAVLPLKMGPARQRPRPRLRGLLISQVRATGSSQEFFVALGEEGIPVPFRGDAWRYAWREEGGTLYLWLGFPDVVFSASMDAHPRLCVEVLGERRSGMPSLARLEITIKPAGSSEEEAKRFSWTGD